MMRKKILQVVLILLALAGVARADAVKMKSGGIIKGDVGNPDVHLKTPYGAVRISTGDIKSITAEKDNPGALQHATLHIRTGSRRHEFQSAELSRILFSEAEDDTAEALLNSGTFVKGVLMEDRFDKAEIQPEFLPALDEAADILKQNDRVKIEVQGHTDNVGSAAYNRDLSEMRAREVVTYLMQKGVDASRLKAVGYGEATPIADNDTESGRARNRRVQLEQVP